MRSLNFAIPALLCLLCLQACKKETPEQPPVEDPVLEITTEDITVDPSGKECSVSYTSSKLIVTYTYGEGLAVRDSVNITQSATSVSEPEYNYEFEMKELYGVYYGTQYGLNGEYSYFITLSDLPYGSDGYSQPGGTYYILDVFGPAPESGSFMCPVGTYTLGEPGATAEFTFTPDISFAATIAEDGESRTMNVTFTEGTIEVGKDESGNYVIDAEFVDNNGDTHHITYILNSLLTEPWTRT